MWRRINFWVVCVWPEFISITQLYYSAAHSHALYTPPRLYMLQLISIPYTILVEIKSALQKTISISPFCVINVAVFEMQENTPRGRSFEVLKYQLPVVKIPKYGWYTETLFMISHLHSHALTILYIWYIFTAFSD